MFVCVPEKFSVVVVGDEVGSGASIISQSCVKSLLLAHPPDPPQPSFALPLFEGSTRGLLATYPTHHHLNYSTKVLQFTEQWARGAANLLNPHMGPPLLTNTPFDIRQGKPCGPSTPAGHQPYHELLQNPS